ncbi:hypothetical protein DL96DRAFT_375630 [Flagelloscypha sp. PMI_526]|nr:hypothetical protein DL96DRAFT_375630 [Flagelloscypha sp. PMI_526]
MYPETLPTVFAVASVSSLWRKTALRSPRLWQRISFFGECELSQHHRACVFHRLECCLQRSFPLPLIIRWEDTEIHMNLSVSCCWAKTLFGILALHSHRWQTAKLRLPFGHYAPIFPLDMPILETLVVQNTEEGETGADMGSMPSLHTLGLLSSGRFEEGLPWHQLTTIFLGGESTMNDTTLENCKDIERFYFYPSEFLSDRLGSISVASLKHLSVWCDDTIFSWSDCTMPSLESLTLDYNYAKLPEPDNVRQFLEQCPSLHLLQIHFSQLGRGRGNLEANPEPLFELFSSTTVRTLQLKVSRMCNNIHPLPSFLTVNQLKKQFPALCHIHVDVDEAMGPTRDVIIRTTFALSNEVERCHSIRDTSPALQLICLHTSPSHKLQLTGIYPTSSYLRMLSIPLELESEKNLFPVGYLRGFDC